MEDMSQSGRLMVRFIVLLLLAAALFAFVYFVVPAIVLPAFRKFIPIP